MVAFKISACKTGDNKDLLIVYNANRTNEKVILPEGEWEIFIDGKNAGTDVLDTVSGRIWIDGISMIAAVKK